MPQTKVTPAVSSERPGVVLPLVWAGALLAVPLRMVLLADGVVNRPSVSPAIRPARLTFMETGPLEREEAS